MKRFAFLFVIAAIIAVAFLPAGAPKYAYAQSFGVSWESGFQVQNLDPVNSATISIAYYNQDGTLDNRFTNPVTDTVAANSSNTYAAIHAPAGFNGSVVIASSRKLAVMTNLTIATPAKGAGTYIGVESGSTKVYFPLIMAKNSYITSVFNVQNTGNSPADITIKFAPQVGQGFPEMPDITDTIPVGAAHTYDLNVRSEWTAVTRWIGAATVSVTDTANDSIAGVANNVNVRYPNAYQLLTYNGFSSGSTEVILPFIMENNNGNRTTISCQNIGTSGNTNMTVEYIPSPGYGTKASESINDVPVNGMGVWYQAYNTAAPRWLGSAKVTSTANDIVCVVNQQKPSVGRGSSYEGFAPSKATAKVVMPFIASRNGSGYLYTSFSIATADGLSHTIRCDWLPGAGFSDPGYVDLEGATVQNLQNDIFGTGARFIGSAVCTPTDGSGVGLFGIVNQQRQSPPEPIRDTFTTYDAFNVAP